jgi:CRISPR-associated protein Cas1
MNFRVVYISSGCRLSFKNNNFVVKNDKGVTQIPLSDISVVLIENLSSSITTKLLSNLTQNKITTIVCDEHHLPNGILLPFNGKIRMLESYKYQTLSNQKFKNNLWDKIIKNKIYNQATVLEYANKNESSTILELSKNIIDGDKLNIEAQVAQTYWKLIFNESFHYFTRNMDDIRNSALNYGYAIIRSIIANTLSCKGFILYDGIHHKSELNQFNLVDDIIEPFRAFVDLEVYEIFENNGCTKENLDSELKKILLNIVDSEVYINQQKFTLINAIDKYCDSVYNCYKYNNSKKLIEINLNIWN